MKQMPDFLQQVVIENNLKPLEGQIEAPFSPWISRVQDEQGNAFIIKQKGDQPYKVNEARCMQTFYASGCVPRVSSLDPQGIYMLVEDKGGCDLGEVHAVDYAGQVAQMLRDLHQVVIPDFALSLKQVLTMRHYSHPGGTLKGHRPARMEQAADALVKDLLDKCDKIEHVFLHGDMHVWNVVKGQDQKLWAIDAFGLSGPAQWDIALFAAYCEDPLSACQKMISVYPQTALEIEPWLCFACFVAYTNLRAHGRSVKLVEQVFWDLI